MFDYIQRARSRPNRGELEITDVNNAYIQAGRHDEPRCSSGWWTDAGTFDSLRRATNLVADGGANRMDRMMRSIILKSSWIRKPGVKWL